MSYLSQDAQVCHPQSHQNHTASLTYKYYQSPPEAVGSPIPSDTPSVEPPASPDWALQSSSSPVLPCLFTAHLLLTDRFGGGAGTLRTIDPLSKEMALTRHGQKIHWKEDPQSNRRDGGSLCVFQPVKSADHRQGSEEFLPWVAHV